MANEDTPEEKEDVRITTAKSPRRVRGYPVRPEPMLRRVRLLKTRAPYTRRPRMHARPWKYVTRLDEQAALEERAIQGIQGSLQERIVFKALVQHGFKEGVDFTFQSSMMGGRAELGGLVADFMFEGTKVIIQVQSYWHRLAADIVQRDTDQALVLTALGYHVLELWPVVIEDQARLDEWMQRNLMLFWGTSYSGLSSGGARSLAYLEAISALRSFLIRWQRQLDEIVVVLRGN